MNLKIAVTAEEDVALTFRYSVMSFTPAHLTFWSDKSLDERTEAATVIASTDK